MLQIYDKNDHSQIKADRDILDGLHVQYDVLSTSEINKRFKPFHLEDNFTGVYDHTGGTLMASKCLPAVQVSERYHGIFIS